MAVIAASQDRQMRMPVHPVRTKRRRPKRSMKRPLKRLPGTVRRLKKPRRRSGVEPVMPRPAKSWVL